MSTQVSTPAKRPTGEILFALVFVSVGAAGLLTAGSIPIPPSETGIGPRAFPYIVCTMLVLVGTGIVAQVFRGKVVDIASDALGSFGGTFMNRFVDSSAVLARSRNSFNSHN